MALGLKKIPHLLTILDASGLDVVCLQEIGSLNSVQPLCLTAFHIWVGDAVAGGGLAILLHPRQSPALGRAVRIRCQQRLLSVTIPLAGLAFTVVNLHLPPRLPFSQRRSICRDAALICQRSSLGAKVLCGDLNEWLGLLVVVGCSKPLPLRAPG